MGKTAKAVHRSNLPERLFASLVVNARDQGEARGENRLCHAQKESSSHKATEIRACCMAHKNPAPDNDACA